MKNQSIGRHGNLRMDFLLSVGAGIRMEDSGEEPGSYGEMVVGRGGSW